MRKVKRVVFILLGIIAALLAIILFMFRNELHSLSSIEKIDDYGMYEMKYYGDYGFDEFLSMGAQKDSDIETFITKRLLKGLPIDLNMTKPGCTAFVTKNDSGDIIMGRNYDFDYSPSMVLYTKPNNGYASISTVNLAFVGYSENKLPSGMNVDSFLSLAAPYLPCDGMNEQGVAIAVLAVPETETPYPSDSNKVTLNTTTSIRLVLDKAATVEEAVDLLKEYNIYFSEDVYCHFLIGDKTGKSVIVEYYDGAIREVYPNSEYQIASNFIAYNDVNIGEGYNEFERYDAVKNAIISNNGTINTDESLELLAQVGVVNKKGVDKLQWSCVYNLSTLDEDIFAHRNVENTKHFNLK